MSAQLQASRVIVAATAESQPRIRAILPECDLCFVDTERELHRALARGRCDMLIVGAHFQESGAVAAIEQVLLRDETIPVVCIRARPFATPLGQPAVDALRIATRALGASNFIDLLEYPDDERGNARVRRMLERLLLPQDQGLR
jgi:hypothetical protein